MRRREWIAGGVVGLLLLASMAYLQRVRSTAHETGKVQSGTNNSGYVDSAVCSGCHANIAQTYRLTGMGRSFYRPTPGNTIGAHHQSSVFYHKVSDSYFTILERDGRFYQRRYQVGFDGKETNAIEKEIDFVMGSGNHVRAYLHRTSRNTLVELPLAWYAENGGSWGMNPGYDRLDHPGFRRNITYPCMFCHNGIPQIPSGGSDPGAEPVFEGRMPEGIDCQRCHGPGEQHVVLAQTPGAKLAGIRNAIVNPARLSSEREMEVCLQCHLETTSNRLPSSIVRYDRGPFSYKPGEPLAKFTLHFDQFPANDRFEIAGAAYRLRRSACFQKSADRLRCTTCHNPHDIPRGEKAAEHYTQVCRQCHSTGLNQLVAAAKHPPSADCVGCHMPKRRTDDAVHVVMTDHYIQRRTAARDVLEPPAKGRETSEDSYRGEVVPYYPQPLPNAPESELYVAVAQVSQNSNLSEGIKALTAAIGKYRPDRMEYYLQLADALGASGQTEKAIPLYEEALRRQPDSFAALRKLASGLRSSGQFTRAAEILHQALQAQPADAAAWHELGLTYLNEGLKSDALAAFQKAITLDEDMAEAYNSLGGVWLENGAVPRAEQAFRSAIRIQPDYAEAHSNLGNALGSAGRFEEARYHFEIALRIQPAYAAARYNYGIALARVNRFEEAQRQIELLLRFDAANAEAHDLLGNLFVARGKLQAALDQYREAIRIRPAFGRARLDLGETLADSGDLPGALPHLRAAAESPEPAVRQEALDLLQRLGNAH
jgi:predicted CXXCH cytochrome family protein